MRIIIKTREKLFSKKKKNWNNTNMMRLQKLFCASFYLKPFWSIYLLKMFSCWFRHNVWCKLKWSFLLDDRVRKYNEHIKCGGKKIGSNHDNHIKEKKYWEITYNWNLNSQLKNKWWLISRNVFNIAFDPLVGLRIELFSF